MDTTGGAGPEYGTRQAPPIGGASPSARAEAAQGPGITESINAVYTSTRQAFADFVELISLELHRAGITFMWMLAFSTFAVLLAITAWLGLMAGLALWIISLDNSPAAVVLGIALANLLGGAALLSWCVKASKDLLMPATRRQLKNTAADVKSA